MYKYLIALLVLFCSTTVFADAESCQSLKEKDKTLLLRVEKLMNSYKDEVSVFGFSSMMVKERNFEDAGENIVRMAGIVNGCKSLLDEKTCKYVSKEIIALIKEGVQHCMADQKSKCGLC